MPIPLSQTSAFVLVCDQNTSYQNPKSKEFLSHLNLSEGQKMYNRVQHLKPHLDEIIPNRKFLIHNYIRTILKKSKSPIQVLVLGCGWDPILVEISEEFPKHSFFGIDSESVELQETLIKKMVLQSSIFYLKVNITNIKKLIQKLTKKGWKKDQPTCIVVEGIIYYIPLEAFWNSLGELKQNVKADCFICGDFLIDEKKQNISKVSKSLANTIFDMIKESCSQEYYSATVQEIQKKLECMGFSRIQFFTQADIQKRRRGTVKPWKEKEGHIYLFTAQDKL